MGWLRVGPAYFPPQPDAAQVIMRGPHGARFSVDPVAQRLANPDQRGFQWWKEQMLQQGDYTGFWEPQQYVTEVMGLGDLPSGWRCPVPRADMDSAIAEVEVQAMDPSVPVEKVRARIEELRECHMQLGEHQTYRLHLQRINNVHNLLLRRQQKIDPRAVTSTGAPRVDDPVRAGVQSFQRDVLRMPGLVSQSTAGWWERNWWKVALAAAAVPFVYGAGRGVGGRLF